MDNRVKRFKKKLYEIFELENMEKEIIKVVLCELENYYIAQDLLKKEGQIVKSKNGYIRKNPAIEISKISYNNFINGIKNLGLFKNLQQENLKPNKVGRPLQRG